MAISDRSIFFAKSRVCGGDLGKIRHLYGAVREGGWFVDGLAASVSVFEVRLPKGLCN